MGLDDANLVDYSDSVHHFMRVVGERFHRVRDRHRLGWRREHRANVPSAGAAVAVDGPYDAQDGTTGAPVILIRGTNTSPSHILLQDDQTHMVGETAHLLATVTNPNLEPTC